jgi:hypothetical protein
VIFNFAIDCKVHFSLEIQRKTNFEHGISKLFFTPRRQSALSRDVTRAPRQLAVRAPCVYAEAPDDPSVHAPRRRTTVGDVRGRLDGARWL